MPRHRDDENEVARVVHVSTTNRQTGNFNSGFGGAFGCLCGIAAFFVLGGALLIAGCAGWFKAADYATERAKEQKFMAEKHAANAKEAAEQLAALKLAKAEKAKEAGRVAAERERATESAGVRIEVVGTKVGPTQLLVDGKAQESGVDFFTVTLRLTTTKDDRVYAYRSGGLANADACRIVDGKGRTIKPHTKTGDAMPVGHTAAGTVSKGQPLTDVLLFWPPEVDAGDLTLEVPILDTPGSVAKVVIPESSWKK